MKFAIATALPADLPEGGPGVVQMATGNAELEALAGAWDGLAAACQAPPMLYASWACAYARTFGSERLRVLYVGSPARLHAIAPLVTTGVPGARLELLGVTEFFEPADFLWSDPAALQSLAEAVVALGVGVRLDRMPADSAVIGALRRAYRGRGWLRVLPRRGCPYIALRPDWAEPERLFDAGRRSDFRRARRRAESIGAVSFEVVAPGPERCKALLDEAYRVEAAGWKGAAGSALSQDTTRGYFFRHFLEAACREGLLRLCFMRIGPRAVAMQVAMETAGRFYLLKIGYDEQYRRCSPGILLMLHTVAYAASRGLKSYELLGDEEDWTRQWTRDARPMAAVVAYPWSWRGVAALGWDAGQRTRRWLEEAWS